MKITHLKLEGMKCEGCAQAVRRILDRVEGVREVDVKWVAHEAHVTHSETLEPHQLIEAFAGTAFRASLVKS